MCGAVLPCWMQWAKRSSTWCDRLSATGEGQRPGKVIFVITTDGLENASRESTYTKVKELIKYKQEKYSWEFIFLGANIDVAREADSMGIGKENAFSFSVSKAGMETMYCLVNEVVTEKRQGPQGGCCRQLRAARKLNRMRRVKGNRCVTLCLYSCCLIPNQSIVFNLVLILKSQKGSAPSAFPSCAFFKHEEDLSSFLPRGVSDRNTPSTFSP